MLRMTAFVALTAQLARESFPFYACIPKTQFFSNGRLCHCDITGRWSKKDCQQVPHRRSCQNGQIIWQGCNQCICNNKGELHCTDIYCSDKVYNARKELSVIGYWCIPLKYYRINCSICFCPASGHTSEAQCTVDASCLSNQQSSGKFASVYDTNCIPNVMYIFPCLQCLCSDDGRFLLEKCFEVCQKPTQMKLITKCKPGSFYKQNCNVCRCPQNGIRDDKICINTTCNVNSPKSNLVSLLISQNNCIPYTFTRSRCFICDCNTKGTFNENSCSAINCTRNLEFYNVNLNESCNSEEILPVCVECFCLQNGSFNEKYCTRTCNYQSKLNILEEVLIDSKNIQNLVTYTDIKIIAPKSSCKENSIFLIEDKYCICANGTANLKYCKTFTEKNYYANHYRTSINNQIKINAEMLCQPNTFLDFDCNTCYCSKKGKLDPKWCTYDDCEAKRLIQESNKLQDHFTPEKLSDTCTPGSIFKEKCNYCICPESGLSKERACTKNYCSNDDLFQNTVKFTCDPLAYYEVDCNICLCPRDGLKNVAKCTKNICEKKFLRSDTCSPGHLFIENCNVCLCPLNGNKNDKVCTNYTCPEVATWSNFELSTNLLEDRIGVDTKRSLDLCFPGERFMVDCKQCVCPEMGLKIYAICDNSQCSDKNLVSNEQQNMQYKKSHSQVRIRRDVPCIKYNVSLFEKQCTPGTMYIIRCKQCICPYMGNIVYFCRPLPKNFYCEQPFPNVNYEPMGRRRLKGEDTISNIKPVEGEVINDLTKYTCNKVGNIMDKCYICECGENHILIEEHCFKSEDKNCSDVRPSFLINAKLII